MGTNAFCAVSLMAMMLIGGVQLAAGVRIPKNLARVLYLENGDYSGTVDTVDLFSKPLKFDANISFIPIIVPGNEKPTVLYREHFAPNRNFILEMKQDFLGLVHAKFYKVKAEDVEESLKHSPAKLPDDAELQVNPLSSCVTSMYGAGIVNGIWVELLWISSGGVAPFYKYAVDCEAFRVTIPTGKILETFPLKFQEGSRYAWVPDVLAEMEKTEDPCPRD